MNSVIDYWNNRPCNIRHSSAEFGTEEYFNQVEARKYFVEPHIPVFAEFARWSGKKVLEVGCGIGTDTINFLRSGANLTSIDVSDRSVDITKNRTKLFGFDPDRIKCQNIEEYSSSGGDKFDLVYSFGVIHHTENPKRAIESISAVQDVGQELRIMLYSKFSYKLFWAMHENERWDLSRMDDTIREFAEAQTGCPIAYTYTFDDVKELLEPWYEITDIRKDHIFIWDIEKYKNHEYVVDKAWQVVSSETLASMEKELGWHTLVKAKRK
jgi:SAM-dependent methyltransferase